MSPVIWLVNGPAPEPSTVWLPDVVGFGAKPQQTPQAVTSAPPSEMTFPPLEAPVDVTDLTAAVVTAGSANPPVAV